MVPKDDTKTEVTGKTPKEDEGIGDLYLPGSRIPIRRKETINDTSGDRIPKLIVCVQLLRVYIEVDTGVGTYCLSVGGRRSCKGLRIDHKFRSYSGRLEDGREGRCRGFLEEVGSVAVEVRW